MTTNAAPHRSPPHGYTYAGELFNDLGMPEWRWLLYANLLALIPLGVAIVLLWLPYQVYLAFGAPLALPAPEWSPVITVVLGIGILLASALLHETLHGVALRALGHTPRLTFARGFLFASISGFITRRHYLAMVLTPLLSMSVVGALLLLVLPVPLGQWLLVALLLNAAASIGDLAVAVRVYRLPDGALFADQNGIQVYLPDNLNFSV